jgi:hypothetical protein
VSAVGLYEWRPRSWCTGTCGEAATSEAIASGSATPSPGPYRFLYTDEELPYGGHRLTLTPLVRGDGAGPSA